MDDPDKFYAFLAKTLLLPVAWPLATCGGVTSGAVGVGNTNIETIQFPGQKSSHAKTGNDVGTLYLNQLAAVCLKSWKRKSTISAALLARRKAVLT
jgi:hypothetical protein